MSCLDLPSSYLALITPSLSKPFTTKQWSCTADFLARENHVAYVASSSSIEQEKAQKSAFHYTPEQQQSPKVLPYQLFFFSEMGSSEILCEAKNGQNCFPIVKNYGLWKWSSSLHKGHHPVGSPFSMVSNDKKSLLSLCSFKTHIWKKSHKKHIGRV